MKNKKIEIKLDNIYVDKCDNSKRYIFSIKNRTSKLKYIVYYWGKVTYIARSYNNKIQSAYTKTDIIYRMNKLKNNKFELRKSHICKYCDEYKSIMKMYLKIVNKFGSFI